MKKNKSFWLTVILFLLPAFILYFGFIFYPVIQTIINSFFKLDMTQGMKYTFVGVDYFKEIFTSDQVFPKAAYNSLRWAFISPLIEIPLGFILALTISKRPPFGRFFRFAWFSPILLSFIVVGTIWRWIYNFDWGFANRLLGWVGFEPQNWLGNINLALPSLIVVTTWMFTGFNMVILLAAISSIPKDLIDAATIDGANTKNIVTKIMIPLLRPTIANLLILCFIGKMKVYDLVWVMTGGGPLWASETVATYVIKRAFYWRTLDLGYPSALAVLWFGVILLLSLLFNKVLKSKEKYEF